MSRPAKISVNEYPPGVDTALDTLQATLTWLDTRRRRGLDLAQASELLGRVRSVKRELARLEERNE